MSLQYPRLLELYDQLVPPPLCDRYTATDANGMIEAVA